MVRGYYPEPWIRTSCDIDILVHDEDINKAINLLVQKFSYSISNKKGYHDITLYSPSDVHLELHFNIKENMENIDPLLGRVWDYCTVVEGKKYEHRQSNEYLMFHLISHMSYHFIHGGCGIKPFMDLYVLDANLKYDREELVKMCRECGLERFYNSVYELSSVWFGEAEETTLTKRMETYLLVGGVYGTEEQYIAVQQKDEGGKIKYMLRKMFLPYNTLKRLYPVVEKHRWLVPICHIRRWFSLILPSKLQYSVRKLRVATTMDKTKVSAVAQLMNDVGL